MIWFGKLSRCYARLLFSMVCWSLDVLFFIFWLRAVCLFCCCIRCFLFCVKTCVCVCKHNMVAFGKFYDLLDFTQFV